jgi:uncharacterized protein with PIN domain
LHTHLLALPRIGAQILAQALAVVGDQLVAASRIWPRAVVLLQLDRFTWNSRSNALIAHIGATEGVDALVVVADGKQRRRAAPAHRQLEPLVLQVIGILELVDQDVAEAAGNARAAAGYGSAAHSAQQQFGKIHHAFALALLSSYSWYSSTFLRSSAL